MTDTTPTALHDQFAFAVYAAGHAVQRAYRPMLDGLGLTFPQYLVMTALWNGDGQGVGAIGSRVDLDSATLTPLIKRLEAAGLVRRTRNPADERQVIVTLTEAGRALQAQAAGLPARLLAATGQDAGTLAALTRALHIVREALDRQDG